MSSPAAVPQPGAAERRFELPAFCPRGHRVIPSSGYCWTMRELEPGVYEYVTGACEELP